MSEDKQHRDDLVACDSYKSGVDIDQLPCGVCRYCHRAHAQWRHFEDEVDYVVPLTLRAIKNTSDEIEVILTCGLLLILQ